MDEKETSQVGCFSRMWEVWDAMRYIGFYLVISVDITIDNTLMISMDLCSLLYRCVSSPPCLWKFSQCHHPNSQANPQVGPCSQLWIVSYFHVLTSDDICRCGFLPCLSCFFVGRFLWCQIFKISKERSLREAILQTLRNVGSFSLWYHSHTHHPSHLTHRANCEVRAHCLSLLVCLAFRQVLYIVFLCCWSALSSIPVLMVWHRLSIICHHLESFVHAPYLPLPGWGKQVYTYFVGGDVSWQDGKAEDARNQGFNLQEIRPQTLNHLFLKEILSHLHFGYLGYVAGVCWNFLEHESNMCCPIWLPVINLECLFEIQGPFFSKGRTSTIYISHVVKRTWEKIRTKVYPRSEQKTLRSTRGWGQQQHIRHIW